MKDNVNKFTVIFKDGTEREFCEKNVGYTDEQISNRFLSYGVFSEESPKGSGKYALLALMLTLCTLFFLSSESNAEKGDVHLNIGLYTEHVYQDRPYYNEDNRLIQLSYEGKHAIYTGATFINSYYARSYLVGIGKKFNIEAIDTEVYTALGAVRGYEGFIPTQVDGLIFGPLVAVKHGLIKVSFLGEAMNVGIEVQL